MNTIHKFLLEQPYQRSLLRLVVESDAEFILYLRTQKELCKYISRTVNDVEKQKSWIRNYKARESNCSEYYFIIMSDNLPVGTIRMYDFTSLSFCWGSWIILPGLRLQTALESMLNLYFISFDKMKYQEAKIDVRNDNVNVLGIHKKMGAKVKEITDLDTYFELNIDDYLVKMKKIEKLLNKMKVNYG